MENIHSLGKVTLETSLFADNGKTIEIVGSVHQASIPLFFNSHESITFKEVLNSVQKNESGYCNQTKALLSANLKSLLSVECPLLLKYPNVENLRNSDVLRINHSFTAPERRLTLPTPTVCFSASEDETHYSNLVQNLFKKEAVQAAIMKVMKQKLEMRLDKLFEEVVKYFEDDRVVKFDFSYLKSQVGTLVQKDDLKDHGGSNPTITYLQ